MWSNGEGWEVKPLEVDRIDGPGDSGVCSSFHIRFPPESGKGPLMRATFIFTANADENVLLHEKFCRSIGLTSFLLET